MPLTELKDSQPRLSVLLTAGNRRERVANALASVLTQSLVDEIEIVVLECGDPGQPPVPGQDHPSVRTVAFPQGLGAGDIRAQAVRLARAPIIVFLEEHAAACPGWIEGMLRDFDTGDWTAVGPEMVNGNPGIGISDAMSLASYPQYEAPARRQEPGWLPFHNSAYRREAVMRHESDLPRLFAVEMLLQWRLQEDGCRFLLDPACKVIHYYETDVATIWRHEWNAQRAFVCNRADAYQWPFWKRLGRFLAGPLIPLVRPAKLLRLLLRERPDDVRSFLAGLPVMVVSTYSACAAGEMTGLLFGAGRGDARYLYHSVNAPRRMPADFPHFRWEGSKP